MQAEYFSGPKPHDVSIKPFSHDRRPGTAERALNRVLRELGSYANC